jgi:hypothetical protein
MTGCVYQYVKLSKFSLNAFNRLENICFQGHIGLEHHGARTNRIEFLPKAVERLRIAAQCRDPGTLFRKAEGSCAPDTRGCARY